MSDEPEESRMEWDVHAPDPRELTDDDQKAVATFVRYCHETGATGCAYIVNSENGTFFSGFGQIPPLVNGSVNNLLYLMERGAAHDIEAARVATLAIIGDLVVAMLKDTEEDGDGE